MVHRYCPGCGMELLTEDDHRDVNGRLICCRPVLPLGNTSRQYLIEVKHGNNGIPEYFLYKMIEDDKGIDPEYMETGTFEDVVTALRAAEGVQ